MHLSMPGHVPGHLLAPAATVQTRYLSTLLTVCAGFHPAHCQTHTLADTGLDLLPAGLDLKAA